MSLNRIVLGIGTFAFFLLNSCEDKQSKKNTSPHSKSSVIKVEDTSTSTKAPVTKIKTIEKSPEKISNKGKLNNKNLREFLTDYGKKNKETLVRITTKFGAFDIKLFTETPLHRANFIFLTKEKYFDETFFYRVAKGFVIQGGNSDRDEMAQKRFEIGDYTLPQEQVSRLKHQRSYVALSKQWVDNPSNRSTPYEFFVVVSKKGAPHLDGEHTIFGKVVKGMHVVDKISNVPVDGSEWPKENIFIKAKVIR